jgi:uncharacterized protein YceH (UPF0502 family)
MLPLMLELTIHEARALGVLVEKAQTTPDQYPLSLNALTNGANQKNNRDPVMELTEDDILTAVIGLREKGLLIQSDTPGARVSKYRHNALDALGISLRELVILAELLLRGPQTIGELRGRASRMHGFDTLEMVQSTLDTLLGKPEPLVRRLLPSPGSRAERYTQLLCPETIPDLAAEAPASPADPSVSAAAPTLSQRVAQLESDVTQLKTLLDKLCTDLGIIR